MEQCHASVAALDVSKRGLRSPFCAPCVVPCMVGPRSAPLFCRHTKCAPASSLSERAVSGHADGGWALMARAPLVRRYPEAVRVSAHLAGPVHAQHVLPGVCATTALVSGGSSAPCAHRRETRRRVWPLPVLPANAPFALGAPRARWGGTRRNGSGQLLKQRTTALAPPTGSRSAQVMMRCAEGAQDPTGGSQ